MIEYLCGKLLALAGQAVVEGGRWGLLLRSRMLPKNWSSLSVRVKFYTRLVFRDDDFAFTVSSAEGEIS